MIILIMLAGFMMLIFLSEKKGLMETLFHAFVTGSFMALCFLPAILQAHPAWFGLVFLVGVPFFAIYFGERDKVWAWVKTKIRK